MKLLEIRYILQLNSLLKGKKLNNVSISNKHANFLINSNKLSMFDYALSEADSNESLIKLNNSKLKLKTRNWKLNNKQIHDLLE